MGMTGIVTNHKLKYRALWFFTCTLYTLIHPFITSTAPHITRAFIAFYSSNFNGDIFVIDDDWLMIVGGYEAFWLMIGD